MVGSSPKFAFCFKNSVKKLGQFFARQGRAMDRNLIVIDNFLDNPDYIRQRALELDFDRVQETVPGLRSMSLGGDLLTEVEE